MAMAASTSSAADSINYRRYDVFINHRGPDVKKTFASHLYHRLISYGLHVFLDYQEMQEGEGLTCQIQGAIRTASTHVAIFSPTYADSKWCLDELVLMLESGAPIIPVFHRVKQAELRQTRGEGVYARSLHNLEKKRDRDSQPRYSSVIIEKWRDALFRVADISGFELEAFNNYEGDLLDKVVETVVLRTRSARKLDVAKYPCGLDEQVEDFERKVLLQQHMERVQVVGITGLVGVGKTTLAKELFNRKSSSYSKSHFLFDISENAKRSLPSLQSSLLSGLLHLQRHIDNRHQGIELLRKHLSSSQVLLVLDDVDHVDQVKALLQVDVLRPGSLILIISRDKKILLRSGVEESSIYKLTGLNRERSRELFCRHAFRQPHPLPGFEYLVDQFLMRCSGLPLSLKVFGAFLCSIGNKFDWEDMLERLDQSLPSDIEERLRISYDELHEDDQRIFVDIACFFTGEKMETAIRIWEGSGWQGSMGFQNLQDKNLVEVDIENKIRMHNHLRSLGRAIAEDPKLPHRLWRVRGIQHIDDLLQQSSVLSEVRGIRMLPSEYEDTEYDYEDNDDEYKSFSCYNLQLLDIESGSLEHILRTAESRNLIWLRWSKCPYPYLPPWIPMGNMRVLHVDGRALKTLWQGESQVPLALRELQIFAPLSNIPRSIGQLKHLEQIVITCPLRGEKNIEKLPDEFCNLRSLKALVLKGCSRMRSLPYSFGNLAKLEHIDLSHSHNLEWLPNSFRKLIRLKYLDLSACFNLTISSQALGNISTLEYIDLTGCDKIEKLPHQVAHQRSLNKLNLDLRNLKELPINIGELSDLKELVLKCPLLESLPLSLCDLRNLKYLELRSCKKLERLPDSVEQLNQLIKMAVNNCPLIELPSAMGGLSNLEELVLESPLLETLPSSLYSLRNLKHLELRNCQKLDRLPDSVGGLKQLTKMTLINCPLTELPSAIGEFSHLEELVLESLLLETMPPSLGDLWNLKYLELRSCQKLKRLPDSVRRLSQLSQLTVNYCPLSQLPLFEEGNGEREIFTESRRRLTLDSSVEMCMLGLQHLKLTKTEISEVSLRQGSCPNLQHLQIWACHDLMEVRALPNTLTKLQLTDCRNLRKTEGICDLAKLQILDISRCKEVEDLPSVETMVSLEVLRASECVKLKSIRGLAQLTKLMFLDISWCCQIEELLGVNHLRSLEVLYAYRCIKLKSILVAQLTKLRILDVSDCFQLEELPGVEHLSSLEEMSASECIKLKSIRGFVGLSQLRILNISDCSKLEELSGIEHLRSLEKLLASQCVKLNRIAELEQLEKLQILNVSKCSDLEFLPGVEHLKLLEELWASECRKLKSIRGLGQLTKLRTIDISECPELKELEGVEHLRSLKKLNAYGCPKLQWSGTAVGQLRQQLTELNL